MFWFLDFVLISDKLIKSFFNPQRTEPWRQQWCLGKWRRKRWTCSVARSQRTRWNGDACGGHQGRPRGCQEAARSRNEPECGRFCGYVLVLVILFSYLIKIFMIILKIRLDPAARGMQSRSLQCGSDPRESRRQCERQRSGRRHSVARCGHCGPIEVGQVVGRTWRRCVLQESKGQDSLRCGRSGSIQFSAGNQRWVNHIFSISNNSYIFEIHSSKFRIVFPTKRRLFTNLRLWYFTITHNHPSPPSYPFSPLFLSPWSNPPPPRHALRRLEVCMETTPCGWVCLCFYVAKCYAMLTACA